MTKKENGNVLFIIIVAIGLLAALMISLSESERYEDTIDDEKMNLQIQELYEFGNKLEKAVHRVMLDNGCDTGELNFDHPEFENYDTGGRKNPISPTDKSCHIFEPEGGGVPYQVPPKMSADLGAYEYGIISRFVIYDVGTNTGNEGADLILQTIVPRKACLQINNDNDITNPSGNPPKFNHWSRSPPYAGKDLYPTIDMNGGSEGMMNNWILGDGGTMANIAGHKTGCFETDNDGLFSFYHVILAR